MCQIIATSSELHILLANNFLTLTLLTLPATPSEQQQQQQEITQFCNM